MTNEKQVDYGEIGGRLKKIRKFRQLTQEALATKIGSTKNYISAIENQVSIPSIEVICKLAMALDTTPDYFLLGTIRDTDRSEVEQKLILCNETQYALVNNFVTWVLDQGDKIK